jgi:hypothetical protein
MVEGGSAYSSQLALNQAVQGLAVGRVEASRSPDYSEGDYVQHGLGWREFSILPTAAAERLKPRKIDVGLQRPDKTYLGALGPVGLTAWAGLFKVLPLGKDDVVYVSGAAGAVGSLAVQIAKLNGNVVIGSAGSAAKAQYIRDELGADAAFCRRDGDLTALLKKAAPEGIDYYFDNVGGDHLEAALEAIRPGGRIALCGAISTYNATAPTPGPTNLFNAIAKGLTLRGFLVGMYTEHLDEFYQQMGGWLAEGRIRFTETIREGIEAAPGAFIDLLAGENTGKMLVKL